jgi:hypothetical protein
VSNNSGNRSEGIGKRERVDEDRDRK